LGPSFANATQVLATVAQELVHLHVEVGAAYVKTMNSSKPSAELMDEIMQKFGQGDKPQAMDTATDDVDAVLSGAAPAPSTGNSSNPQRRRGNLRSHLLAVSTCKEGKVIMCRNPCSLSYYCS